MNIKSDPMLPYHRYRLDDFRCEYEALAKVDPDGEWYKREEVDDRIAYLERLVSSLEKDADRLDKLGRMAMRGKVSIVDTGVIPYRVCLNGQVLGNGLRQVIDKAIE